MSEFQFRRGGLLAFDEAATAEMVREFAEIEKHPPPGLRGCRIFFLSLVALPVVLFLLIVALLIYLKWG